MKKDMSDKNQNQNQENNKWKTLWKKEWNEETFTLSETVVSLNCTPFLQQTQIYKGEKKKYYRFSVPDSYISHGILAPDETYKILIREILTKRENPKPLKTKTKWEKKWKKTWGEDIYELSNTVHTLKESMTIAQTKTTPDGEKKIFWKFTIPGDFTKYGLIDPNKKYRLLIREIYSQE
jgi:hypothetical protein